MLVRLLVGMDAIVFKELETLLNIISLPLKVGISLFLTVFLTFTPFGSFDPIFSYFPPLFH